MSDNDTDGAIVEPAHLTEPSFDLRQYFSLEKLNSLMKSDLVHVRKRETELRILNLRGLTTFIHLLHVTGLLCQHMLDLKLCQHNSPLMVHF